MPGPAALRARTLPHGSSGLGWWWWWWVAVEASRVLPDTTPAICTPTPTPKPPSHIRPLIHPCMPYPLEDVSPAPPPHTHTPSLTHPACSHTIVQTSAHNPSQPQPQQQQKQQQHAGRPQAPHPRDSPPPLGRAPLLQKPLLHVLSTSSLPLVPKPGDVVTVKVGWSVGWVAGGQGGGGRMRCARTHEYRHTCMHTLSGTHRAVCPCGCAHHHLLPWPAVPGSVPCALLLPCRPPHPRAPWPLGRRAALVDAAASTPPPPDQPRGPDQRQLHHHVRGRARAGAGVQGYHQVGGGRAGECGAQAGRGWGASERRHAGSRFFAPPAQVDARRGAPLHIWACCAGVAALGHIEQDACRCICKCACIMGVLVGGLPSFPLSAEQRPSFL